MPTCDIALELFAQLTYNHAQTGLGRCQTAMENRLILLYLFDFKHFYIKRETIPEPSGTPGCRQLGRDRMIHSRFDQIGDKRNNDAAVHRFV